MRAPVVHADAPPGKELKYARPERERRYLLHAVPAGTPVRRILVEDRYLTGTRVRLRRMTDVSEQPRLAVSHKLTQKIPSADGGPGLITTLYLSAAEYAVFAAVPAATLRKVRASYPPVVVDLFEGSLQGLILAEVEFESDVDEAAFESPTDVVAEVTADIRFTGGRLARMTDAELRALLAGFGVAA